jgi:hypothetical protein
MTTETLLTFSSEVTGLIAQLKSCDDACIAGLTTDENLDGLWHIDMIRKLADWDLPGCLSGAASPVLCLLGDLKGSQYKMEYVAVLCTEADNNPTWREQYVCDAQWLHHPKQQSRVVHGNHYGVSDQRYYKREHGTGLDPEFLITVPFTAEGINIYLIVNISPKT